MNRSSCQRRSGFAWLELLLAIAVLALLLQLIAAIVFPLAKIFDVRNWPSWGWFAFFAVLCTSLLTIKVGPDVVRDVQENLANRRRDRRAHEQSEKKTSRAEERALYARMQAARKRRIY